MEPRELNELEWYERTQLEKDLAALIDIGTMLSGLTDDEDWRWSCTPGMGRAVVALARAMERTLFAPAPALGEAATA